MQHFNDGLDILFANKPTIKSPGSTCTLVTPFRVPLRLYYVYRSKGLRGGFGAVWPMFLWYFPKYIGTKCDVLGMVQGPL
jgi:hypothetical protein